MSIFDGTPEDLTYGEALIELAKRVPWPTEVAGREVIRAIQAEHGLLPPDPEPDPEAPADPRDKAIASQGKELAEMKAKLEEAEKKLAEKDTAHTPPAKDEGVDPGDTKTPAKEDHASKKKH